jgi:hypothetical protein
MIQLEIMCRFRNTELVRENASFPSVVVIMEWEWLEINVNHLFDVD